MACGEDSASGRSPRRHNLRVVRRRTDGANNLRGATSSFGQSGYSAQEGCLPASVPSEGQERPDSVPQVASWGLAAVPYSRASPLAAAEPQPRSRSRLTCQAPDRGPIRGGRSLEAAMFTTLRCQSIWRRPMDCRAGGQVTTGHLPPHWRAPHGLPLGFCERTE